MDYKTLNKNQRDKMKQITHCDFKMDWEDSNLLDTLTGKLPDIRLDCDEKDTAVEIQTLKTILSNYNPYLSDKNRFLEEVNETINRIHNINPRWYGLDMYEVEECLKQHEFCLLSGEGGIGKSFFVKCFEEELEKKKVPHLCIYGKFEKDIRNIDVEEIIRNSNAGFVFVFDAINEMSEMGQNNLLQILKILRKVKSVQIVITYRTHAIDPDILSEYKKICMTECVFPGVSFESALDNILKLSVPDVYKYEDILYSNNALLLSMLCRVLSDSKIVDEKENGIASITYILEHYIKNSICKTFKGKYAFQGVDIWKDTKRVAQWMYKNNEKRIEEKNLLSIVKTGCDFITVMMQSGFMGFYESENTRYLYFTIDSLTDFLIARSLFDDIKEREFDNQINIIKSKVENLFNLEEAIIVVIFDNIAPDYELISKLLSATGLIDHLNYETLLKIKYNKDDIGKFCQYFKPVEIGNLLEIMGGYTDKPFNSTNFLFEYYMLDRNRQIELSELLSGYHFLGRIKGRLRNILYFITFTSGNEDRLDEAYRFALLCSSAPNKDVRCLAMKTLYTIVEKESRYKNYLIIDYCKFVDEYIKEAIIYVLTCTGKDDGKIKVFLNGLIERECNLTAKSIKRIATCFREPYGFINWKRNNLYRYEATAHISDFLHRTLLRVDLFDKDFLPFRYWGKDHIDMHTKFLANDKMQIAAINNYLTQKYACVKNGKCCGNMNFDKWIAEEINIEKPLVALDDQSFLIAFNNVLVEIFKIYCISMDEDEKYQRAEDFTHSVFMKCVDIAIGIYYGSLMCNYYTDEFATYNNYQDSIGYEVYDPLEYGEQVMIMSPIPTYQDYVEQLGDIVIGNIELPDNKDENWARNIQLTRKNVLSLLKTVTIKGVEWIMIAGRVSINAENDHETKWKDTYDIWCCTSEYETILNDGEERYLTIELDEYIGGLKEYIKNDDKPWLCKMVKNISYGSDVFEETSLVLPPSDLISFFDLHVDLSDISWVSKSGERVIVCNNNKNSYYINPIGETVFMKKSYFDEYIKNHKIKYFAFTERYIPETGFADETAMHFEIQNNRIVKEIPNKNDNPKRHTEINPLCKKCPNEIIRKHQEKQEGVLEQYIKLIELYEAED